MAVIIMPNEGKDYICQHAISGASLYYGLYKSVSVGASTITATSTRASLAANEATGTGLARIAVTLGVSTDGIMDCPSKVWSTGSATDWPANCTAYGLFSASTSGTLIYVWDLSATRDMSAANTTLTLHDQSLFAFNPGEA